MNTAGNVRHWPVKIRRNVVKYTNYHIIVRFVFFTMVLHHLTFFPLRYMYTWFRSKPSLYSSAVVVQERATVLTNYVTAAYKQSVFRVKKMHKISDKFRNSNLRAEKRGLRETIQCVRSGSAILHNFIIDFFSCKHKQTNSTNSRYWQNENAVNVQLHIMTFEKYS